MRDKTTVAASAWLNNTPPPSIHPPKKCETMDKVGLKELLANSNDFAWKMNKSSPWAAAAAELQLPGGDENRNSHTKQYMLRDHKQLLLLLCPNQQKSANLQSARKRIESLLCRRIKCVLKYISSVTIERWQLVDVRLMTIKDKIKKKAATSLGI